MLWKKTSACVSFAFYWTGVGSREKPSATTQSTYVIKCFSFFDCVFI